VESVAFLFRDAVVAAGISSGPIVLFPATVADAAAMERQFSESDLDLDDGAPAGTHRQALPQGGYRALEGHLPRFGFQNLARLDMLC